MADKPSSTIKIPQNVTDAIARIAASIVLPEEVAILRDRFEWAYRYGYATGALEERAKITAELSKVGT